MKGYNKIYFDIGANEGIYSIPRAKDEPNTFVVAFEPIPKLVNHMKQLSSHLNNILIVDSAVADFNGTSKFNISPPSQYGDYSCSSLLEFSNKSQTDWPGRTDFKKIDEIEVSVIRLDSFILKNEISKIDYLKIDTQGYDLKVLHGLGQFISIVNEGTMEAAAKESILYEGQNTQNDSIQFLESNGFEITNITYNDIHQNEVNIDFKNKQPKEIKYNKTWTLV